MIRRLSLSLISQIIPLTKDVKNAEEWFSQLTENKKDAATFYLLVSNAMLLLALWVVLSILIWCVWF